jgi:hypothetical protein
MAAEFEERALEIEQQCERERAATAVHEKQEAAVEAEIEASQKETEQKRAELQNAIDELRELLAQTIEIRRDPEKLRSYEPPEMPKGPPGEEYQKIFLTDQLDDLIKAEARQRIKKKKKKKSSPGKGTASPGDSKKKRKKPG